MGTLHSFRRLRHGEPRKLSTPDFLREEKQRDSRRRVLGVIVLVVLIAAVVMLGLWQGF